MVHIRSGLTGLFFLICFSGPAWAQADKKFIRQGNREYEKTNFPNRKYITGRHLIKTKNRVMLFSIPVMLFTGRKNMKMPESSSSKVTG